MTREEALDRLLIVAEMVHEMSARFGALIEERNNLRRVVLAESETYIKTSVKRAKRRVEALRGKQ